MTSLRTTFQEDVEKSIAYHYNSYGNNFPKIFMKVKEEFPKEHSFFDHSQSVVVGKLKTMFCQSLRFLKKMMVSRSDKERGLEEVMSIAPLKLAVHLVFKSTRKEDRELKNDLLTLKFCRIKEVSIEMVDRLFRFVTRI